MNNLRLLATSFGVSLAAALCNLACSGGTEGGSSGSSGTSAGGDADVLHSGGASGSNGTGGATQAGAAGEVTGGGTAGASGATGGSAVEVLNPNLPLPSYDCRTDLETKNCVSISGTLGGVALDRHCAMGASPGAIFLTPERWPAGCQEDETAWTGYTYQVAVPPQAPGTFHHVTSSPDDFYVLGADVIIQLDGVGGDFQSSHFTHGEVAGVVETAPDTGNDIIYGTFRATWAAPDSRCRAGAPITCQEADVHGTFRVEHFLKFD